MRHPDSVHRSVARFGLRLGLGLSLGLNLFLLGCSGFPRLVILHDPLTAQEHVQLGVTYEEQGEWERAMAEYRAALKKDHRHLPALVNLGNVHTQRRHYPEAERYYRKALKLDPNHPMANNNLAWILIIQGTDLAEAEGLIRKAIVSDPDRRAVYLDTLTYWYLKLGRLIEALAALKEAEAHLIPSDESLKAHLAVTRALVTRAMESGVTGVRTIPPGADHPEEIP